MEAKEQEAAQMLKQIEMYQLEEERQKELHRQEVNRSNKEFVEANAEFIRRKKASKEQEKQEVQDILLYQALRDQEMAKREEEEQRIERAKKERQAQLLAQQERIQDNSGKLDELRARRAYVSCYS